MSITRRSTALVQHDAPELEKRGPPHLKATNDSWRVDETSIKVKKVWMYLYRDRAVDSRGEHSGISPQPHTKYSSGQTLLLESACCAADQVIIPNIDQCTPFFHHVSPSLLTDSIPRQHPLAATV